MSFSQAIPAGAALFEVATDGNVNAKADNAGMVRVLPESNLELNDLAVTGTLTLSGSAVIDATLDISPTGYFFEDDGAKVNRVADRLFTNATNDGSTFGGGPGADWFSAGTGVSAGVGWVPYLSANLTVSTNGRVGLSAASRASDADPSINSYQSTIGVIGIAVMDRSSGGPPYWTAYGGYFEARIETVSASTGTAIGIEIDAINFNTTAAGQSTPWQMQTLGGVTALWLASGGDPSSHVRPIGPAQLALGIVNNGETFESGIVFASDAIEGTDGVAGFGDAINFATRHIVGWWADDGGSGERVNYITSTNTVPGHSLQFQDGGTLFVSAAGLTADFEVSNVASSVNGLGVLPAITTAAPSLFANGSDTNIPIALRPKGTGSVDLYADILFFYSDGGSQLAAVVSSVTAPNFLSLEFSNGGAFFQSGAGDVMFNMTRVASAVNYLDARPAVTGQAPGLYAIGDDTNINLVLQPKGTGTLAILAPNTTSAVAGGATALPATPQGYITININGTDRKIAYYNT